MSFNDRGPWVSGDALILPDLYRTVDAARAAATEYLTGAGMDSWAADVALAGARLDRAWWSDAYGGFCHDCDQHSPAEAGPETCFPDTRPVTVVAGLHPDALEAR